MKSRKHCNFFAECLRYVLYKDFFSFSEFHCPIIGVGLGKEA